LVPTEQPDQAGQVGGARGEDLARARAFVEKVPFRVAVTVPQFPHSYALRSWLDPGLQSELDWFVGLITAYGYTGRFWNRTWTYLDVGEFKYWESITIDGTGRIINRARLKPKANCRS
jgi:hypothetical protein